MSPNEAKKQAATALAQADAPFTKLTARRVSFSDLARAQAYAVTVHGSTIGPHNREAKENCPRGVILQFDCANIT